MGEQQENSQSERRDQLIIEAVLDVSPNVYTNELGVTCILLPLDGQDSDKSEFAIRDPRVKAEISCHAFEKTTLIPHHSEINRVLTVLEGKAWKKNKTNVDFLEAIDADPLLETVYIFLKQKKIGGQYEGNCTKLLAELNNIAISKSIHIKIPSWPKGTAQLSHQL